MIILLGAICGAGLGAFVAYRREGRLADILQYAFVYALVFGLGALFLSILIARLVG